METNNPEYAPFLQKITTLAQQFQLEKIETFIQQHISLPVENERGIHGES